jgi:hypothetical protein
MNDKQLHPVLVSIAASYCGRRNSGNLSKKEMPIVQELLQRGLATLEDDDSPTGLMRNVHWVALTEVGQEKLIELNRLKKQW